MGRYGTTEQVFTLFGMIAATYFIMNYAISVYARRVQHKMICKSY